jgi:flavodoxin
LKALIVYESYHHMNTEKIARAMADAMGAKLAKVGDADPASLQGYDLVGFGSGIYFGKHHRTIMAFVSRLPPMSKDAFVFSTSGAGRDQNGALIARLKEKGFNVTGSFSCSGFDTFGPFALVGGLKKGHPDAKDIENARTFAKSLMK